MITIMKDTNRSRPHARRLVMLVTALTVAFGATGVASAAAGAVPRALGAGARAQASSPPPKVLITIEEQAEDIGDRVPSKRWARIKADIATIEAAWKRYQPQARREGINPSLLGDFDRALEGLVVAAKAKNGPDTAQGANDISRALVEILATYERDDPVQVGRLDVIGRQIELDLDAHAPDEVANDIDEARAEWDAIRADVTARSAAVAAQGDATIAALDEAQTTDNTGLLRAEIRVLLELVDSIEELYG
jgi:hypothetical protein